MSSIRIDVPGGRLAADDHGDPAVPAILLVHSAVVNRRAWAGVTPLLVAAGYRVITYDMRGFGESTSEAVEFFAHDDLLAVLDHFGVGRAAVVGNSMGAIVSLDAILAAPGRFAAYAWVGGGIGGFDQEPSSSIEDALFKAESDAEEAGDWDLAAELDAQIWMDGPGQPATRVDPAARAAFKAMDRELLEPGREYGTRVRAKPAIDRLASVPVPTLVVIGGLDTLGTQASAEVLAEGVPGARIVRLPDVAHIVGLEAPARLAALIIEHLAPLPRWS